MFRANALKIMIASPGDVPEERRVVTEEIHRWNDANASARQLILLPVKWETHSTPRMGAPPQEIINRDLLDDADIVIGIFGTRIGTPTADYVSGTVEEIKRHVADGKTAKIYFSDVPIPPSELNEVQYQLVKTFQDECRSTGLYATFTSIQDFSRDFRQHLDIELNSPRYRWLSAPDVPRGANEETPPTADALRLLKAAAATEDGIVILQEDLGGYGLRIGDEEFMDGTPRSIARWREALAKLNEADAFELISNNLYRVTATGYRIAETSEGVAEAQISAFIEHQKTNIRELLDKLNFRQRDLLRLLLLRGGSVRGDVAFLAWKNPSAPYDWNGMSKALTEKGLITATTDLRDGHTTISVNHSLSETLKRELFPRNEDTNASDFSGV